ncbi:MAG TPA: NUDIX domain-containing protein [Gaiellaceae bacterium]|nr:NUDIX domain-containing protein [Gaiellaceae bacterium]
MPDELHIAAAIVRRGDDVLMVLQAGPGEEPVWSIPGGRLEPGEFVVDALVREVREETGIEVTDPGRIAFLAQQDDRQEGYFATIWTWDVAAWRGEIAVDDPDGFVHEAAWVPLDEAAARLDLISWQPLTARHLRGELPEKPVWLRRVHEDGREEIL